MELDVRGTPGWQVRAYLSGLGGAEKADGSFAGPGWTASLWEGEHLAFGARVPRVVIQLDGEPQTVQEVMAKLRLRVTRVGG